MTVEEILEKARVHAAEVAAELLVKADKRKERWSTAQLIILITATISICGFLFNLSNGQKDIKVELSYMVTQSQLASWTMAIKDANQDIHLKIPDPARFRSPPTTAPAGYSDPEN
jgi:uncharacterized protein YybS (DUF2232 family)